MRTLQKSTDKHTHINDCVGQVIGEAPLRAREPFLNRVVVVVAVIQALHYGGEGT
jgi:hypothetical protein